MDIRICVQRQNIVSFFVLTILLCIITLLTKQLVLGKINFINWRQQSGVIYQIGQKRGQSINADLNLSGWNFSKIDIDMDMQYIPKVALLFLSRGYIFTEPIWVEFFQKAADTQLIVQPPANYVGFQKEDLRQYLGHELLPEQEIDRMSVNSRCWNFTDGSRSRLPDIQPSRNIRKDFEDFSNLKYQKKPKIISQQQLFSVYVHTRPEFRGFQEGSIFSDVMIKKVTHTRYAQHSLVEAMRLLLIEALENPLNVKFVMVSESCIPLHHPAVIYTQLITEQKSRIDACTKGQFLNRWVDLMTTEYLTIDNFRKTTQWWALTRPHAQLAVVDQHVNSQFKSYCVTKKICNEPKRIFSCVSDESYFGTLLSVYGLEEETDCVGSLTAVDFTGGWHATQYSRDSDNRDDENFINDLIFKLKGGNNCQLQFELSNIDKLFGPKNKALELQDQLSVQSSYKLMDPSCPLFARKFVNISTIQELMEHFQS